jgi:hypothetical protein
METYPRNYTRKNIKIRESKSLHWKNDYEFIYGKEFKSKLWIKPRINPFNKKLINSLDVVVNEYEGMLSAPTNFNMTLDIVKNKLNFRLLNVEQGENKGYVQEYILKLEGNDETEYLSSYSLGNLIVSDTQINKNDLDQYEISLALSNTYSKELYEDNYEELDYSEPKTLDQLGLAL